MRSPPGGNRSDAERESRRHKQITSDNNSVVANVYTIQRQAGCTHEIKINTQLQLAAQWHTDDVLNNRALDGDVGSDGSTPKTVPTLQDSKARSLKRWRSIPPWQSAASKSSASGTTTRLIWRSCATAPTP
jgi:uncharacterized protein YkwD